MPGKKPSAAAKKTASKASAEVGSRARGGTTSGARQGATARSADRSAARTASRATPKSTAAPAKANGGKVAIGKKVPAFSGPVTGGGTWRLSDAAGKHVVLYFYPRDNTPGCTQEGETFRDLAPAFRKANAVIVGVSPDSLASHEKFKAKYGFPFELISDEQQTLCKLFDVIKEKSLYGRKFMGVERSTFLIDADGVLREQWRKVKVPGHAEAVLAAVKAL
jgi:peroxiredoxin Q/BCP